MLLQKSTKEFKGLNLLDISVIKGLVKFYGINLGRRGEGRNFLISSRALSKVVEAGDLGRSDNVLEIGSGLGALTMALAERTGRVVAIEKDRIAAKASKEILGAYKNVEIRQGDILRFGLEDMYSWFGRRYKLIANIPYSITSSLVRKFLGVDTGRIGPSLIVFMVQKEVAERMVAKRGKTSLLSLAVLRYAHAEIIGIVSHESFWPMPKVESAIIKIIPLNKKFNIEDDQAFWALAHAGFSSPRKQLHHNLANVLSLSKEQIQIKFSELGLNPKCRAENLGVGEWWKLIKLVRFIKS